MSIKEIGKPVRNDIEIFNKYFKELMETKVSLLNLVLGYITMKKGKQVRPTLVFLTSRMMNGETNRANVAAALVELLHTATLIHDDVVDNASERRGIASINAVWKNKIAVLVGDFLLSKGLLTAVDNNEFEFLKISSNAVKRMSEGELLSIEKSKSLEITEEEYFSIISDKTASLLSTCCEMGAVSASASEEERKIMALYGEYVGIAFQLKDDIFDYVSKSITIGKPVGNDLKEKKITLPLIYAFANSPKNESKEIYKLIKKGKLTNKDIDLIIEYVKSKDGLDYAWALAEKYAADAKKLLENFKDSEYKTSLLNFADFAVTRKS